MVIIKMNDSGINTIQQIKQFLKASDSLHISLSSVSLETRYRFIGKVIRRLRYFQLGKGDKHWVLLYLARITGYQRSQLLHLISQARLGKRGWERKPYLRPAKASHRLYSPLDVKLLEKTDEYHLRLSEKATKEILRREVEVFHHHEYQRIARISHSHISNLRQSPFYRQSWVNHTKKRSRQIGIAQPPDNQGKPGSIRIDTVHQRDIYHVNAVDEISQWEVVTAVARINEREMIPALTFLINQFPFVVFNFHSDRGSENINYRVAALLSRLKIKQTKSRPRRPNDNALVETKNGSVIRKNMGWQYLFPHQEIVAMVNDYYTHFFNIYLNYHRPSGYPSLRRDKKGRITKRYDHYQVPYEFLKSLPQAERYLKPGVSFKQLDKIAYQYSDNQFAQLMREKERQLFAKINSYQRKERPLEHY